jgi:putative nucleotidyltransferase with HDIG domain
VASSGHIARYSGGKFAILLPYFDSNRAYSLAEKIRKRVQETFLCSEDTIQRFLTLSTGICTYPHFAANQDDLLTRADIALYKAKNNGKNQTVVYSQSSVSQEDQLKSTLSYSGSRSTTVYALTAAIDAKDHFTFGHSQNVAEYSTILAEAIGLDSTHIDIIREAALLHDIGKIGIPEYILTKPGRLDHDEYEMIKRHVELSIAIVKHLPSLNHVIPSIIAHHERWDGKGYPRGLSGESIPIGARCLAVADSFDAIVSHRPYKAAMPVEYALKEIEAQLGKQFDPIIAQLFVDLVKSGKIKIK